MSSLQSEQKAFYQHIRDPLNNPAPDGIEDRRMGIYRELFFNNIRGFISMGCPVLKSLYTEQAWEALCRRFFAEHHCRSPYFVDITKEFVEYLDHEYQPQAGDHAFMAELAHYEWVELAIEASTGELPEEQVINTLSRSMPVAVSPVAWLLSYQYPVHQISPDQIPAQADGPYYFVVNRNLEFEVIFTQLNPMNAVMLSTIEVNPGLQVEAVIEQMQQHLPQLDNEVVEQGAWQALSQFAAKQVLIQSPGS